MQKRLHLFFNFFAFNLLFFALYLNFIHKEVEVTLPSLPKSTVVEVTVPVTPATEKPAGEKVFKATSAAENPDQPRKGSLN